MTTARIQNGPSKFDFVMALHDDKIVALSIVLEGGEEMTVQAELWSFAKIGRNGYHNGRCRVSGIMQADRPIPRGGGGPAHWTTFTGEYNQRSRQGEVQLGVSYDAAFAAARG